MFIVAVHEILLRHRRVAGTAFGEIFHQWLAGRIVSGIDPIAVLNVLSGGGGYSNPGL